jgi:Domain of unknown function (DUF4219)
MLTTFFAEKMSSNNKQFVKAHVPKLDGLNYQVWAGKMQAYLRSQGLWNMENNPPNLAEGSKLKHIAFCKKERLDWSNCDTRL